MPSSPELVPVPDNEKDLEIHNEVDKVSEQAAPLETEFVNLSIRQTVRTFWKATLFATMAMVAVLMDGYATSTPGNIVANKGFIKQFGTVVSKTGAVSIDSRYVSVWGGIQIVCGLIGQQLGGIVGDRFGRSWARVGFTASLILGCTIEIVSRDWKTWLAAKIFVGLGQGMTQSCTLIYVCEMAPTQIRGACVAFYGIFFALGQLTSAVGLQIVNTTDPFNWLKGVYSQWALHGIWLICLALLPESPWFYARRHDEERCKKVLKRINGGIPGYDLEREYQVLELEIAHEESRKRDAKSSTVKEIFTFPNLNRTLAGMVGMCLVQWTGSSVTFSYATYYFQQAGIDQPFQATCIAYSLLVFGTLLSSFVLTERVGRRALLLTGAAGCSVCNWIIAGLGFVPTKTQTSQNAILGMVCIWVLFYACCIAGPAWGISSELCSPRLRGKATAFCQNSKAAFDVISSFTVPLMLATSGPGARNWGTKTLFVYAVEGTIGFGLNYYLLPEIKGRTYNEIDEMYEARVSPRKMAQYRTRAEVEGIKNVR